MQYELRTETARHRGEHFIDQWLVVDTYNNNTVVAVFAERDVKNPHVDPAEGARLMAFAEASRLNG